MKTSRVRVARVLSGALLALLLTFAVDFFSTDYFTPILFTVPLIATASMGRPWGTGLLSAVALVLAVVAGWRTDGLSALLVLRLSTIALTGLASMWLAALVQQNERRLQMAETQMRVLAENASDIVFRVSKKGVIQWISPSIQGELGYAPEEFIGRPFGDLIRGADTDREWGSFGHLADRDRLEDRAPFTTAFGDQMWMDVTLRAVRDGSDVTGFIGSARRAETDMQREKELQRLAGTDDLTGALRRRAVIDRLEAMSREARRTGNEAAVLFCDVDNFKAINDTFGHAGGDEVLSVIVRRLQDHLRDEDSVARFGGDEFVVVLHSIRSLDDAKRIAENLRTVVSAPISLSDGQTVNATLSMGLTSLRYGEAIRDVLARADAALYDAKALGRNRVVFLD
ncbi:MAG: sensor domain-containing diguanylate cyclase [Candidatus Nanopelagicales bacterium]|nr:sensor domain-containing diguanylate cyclase [Candidatus Nanopelagicales bacterium]MCF8536889.1 sensor domain-containing diguanylate cyclase [Candidatus Nanopelagicales bacterium]MCF8542019.1 sensor domain-containing diguanylate cyclase [Candidatus Nanopelagicales bacterium]MCF8556707.1 sensor domain-containing diguanylate cyclase [Candidatus Nanopelagicales bacterium]